ncbi:MAG: hypothetical protein ACXW3E_03865 [Thermoanaerobaculia bacterium]
MLSSALVFAAALAASAQQSHTDFASLFETSANVITAPGGMMVASSPTRMVILARRAEDGSIVTACVESAEAAEKFLHAKTPASRTAEEK